MTRTPLQDKDDFGATQVDVFGDSPVNHALTAVAQEVAELLKQAYPVQTDASITQEQLPTCKLSVD